MDTNGTIDLSDVCTAAERCADAHQIREVRIVHVDYGERLGDRFAYVPVPICVHGNIADFPFCFTHTSRSRVVNHVTEMRGDLKTRNGGAIGFTISKNEYHADGSRLRKPETLPIYKKRERHTFKVKASPAETPDPYDF